MLNCQVVIVASPQAWFTPCLLLSCVWKTRLTRLRYAAAAEPGIVCALMRC